MSTGPIARVWSNAWLLMFLTTLSWSSNVIASRLAVGEISAMVLAGVRWPVACLMIWPFLGTQLQGTGPTIRKHWLYLFLMGTSGFTLYSALFYLAGAHTTGINLSILLAVTPVFTVTMAWIVHRSRMPAIFILGLGMTLAAALLIATKGNPGSLREVTFNSGDIMIVIAALIYSSFTIALRRRPPMPSLAFFFVMSLFATLTAVPLVVGEWLVGGLYWPSLKGWLILIYSAAFPTLLAQVFYVRSVELIGPQRTGLFYNLVPVLGAMLSVVLLNEPFALYHGMALLLVLGGISIAESSRGRV
ncbi:DMT family transporter [Roseiarcaceae bacterium H3SJ34-1]|uniref:DMT family transporter n=1 Tax=Terripilifer ovatus TaxID=3032367 RepID=UPI003AB9A069|nr:DMT family transporter [Roseiarcaceae bacterium H3SJ34-1]